MTHGELHWEDMRINTPFPTVQEGDSLSHILTPTAGHNFYYALSFSIILLDGE